MKKLLSISSSLRRIRSAWYEFTCIFTPHNIVKIRALPRTWVDRDELMYHAVFQILVDFIELEQQYVDWDDKTSGRFTDRISMQAYIEKHYRPESCRPDYYDEMSDEEKRIMDEGNERHYKQTLELFELYEWYKDGKYEFDALRYYEMTGEDITFTDTGIVYVPTGNPKLITWADYHKLQADHTQTRDEKLLRVIAMRGYLWT